jgi:hypothetical protein
LEFNNKIIGLVRGRNGLRWGDLAWALVEMRGNYDGWLELRIKRWASDGYMILLQF